MIFNSHSIIPISCIFFTWP